MPKCSCRQCRNVVDAEQAAGDGAGIWRRDGTLIGKLNGHVDVYQALFSPRGDRVLTSAFDYTARLWDTNGALISVLHGHKSYLRRGGFSTDGTRAVTSSDDGTARLWDAMTGDSLAVYSHPGVVRFALFAGDRVATAGDDGAVLLRPASTQALVHTACERLRGRPEEEAVAHLCRPH